MCFVSLSSVIVRMIGINLIDIKFQQRMVPVCNIFDDLVIVGL